MFLKKAACGELRRNGSAVAPGNSFAQSITPIKVDQGLTWTKSV
jgi:hypothetical protein